LDIAKKYCAIRYKLFSTSTNDLLNISSQRLAHGLALDRTDVINNGGDLGQAIKNFEKLLINQLHRAGNLNRKFM